ncbi:MAG: TldD/PmbA family protein [Candidatus Eremiobacterota bacterium]
MSNILKTLKAELYRSYRKLTLEDNPSPFFISYLYRNTFDTTIWGKYGDLFEANSNNNSGIYAEVRIGSNEFDNTISGGLYKNSTSDDSYSWIPSPVGNSSDGLKHTLWRLTDCKYKEALMEYYQKKSQMIKEVLIHKGKLDFSIEKPSVNKEKMPELKLPVKEWKNLVKKHSARLKKYKEVNNSFISINARDAHKYYVNTEGSEISSKETNIGIRIVVQGLAEDGMLVERDWNDIFINLEEFPCEDFIEKKIETIISELCELKKAEVLKPYVGPAILFPSASGIFFHEAIGHRLEGERLLSPGEGQTFKGKIGTRILPEFISIHDDPLMKEFNGQSLLGYYPYDDEGIPAQRVCLIEKGILKNFLLSRAVVEDFKHSNGHARATYHEDPIARMSNFIITSSLEYSYDKLKEMLIQEIKAQGKEFGLIIKEAKSGETNTNKYNFQAFKGQPTVVYRVDPSSGEETLVRGTEFIGTPLTSVQKILATGNDYKRVNAFCGAESGFISVSTISPAILIKEVEMQRSTETNLQPLILPPPWYRKG